LEANRVREQGFDPVFKHPLQKGRMVGGFDAEPTQAELATVEACLG
jgi:hypothetical protein